MRVTCFFDSYFFADISRVDASTSQKLNITYHKFLQDYELHPVVDTTKPRKLDRTALSSAFEQPNSAGLGRSYPDNEPQRKRTALASKACEDVEFRRQRGRLIRNFFLDSYYSLDDDVPVAIAQRFGLSVDTFVDFNKGR